PPRLERSFLLSGWQGKSSGRSRSGNRTAAARRLAEAFSGRLCHHLADKTDDHQQEPTSDAAACNAVEQGSKVQSARRRGAARQHAEKLAAQAAAEDSGNGVAQRAEGELLEQCPGKVAAGCTADQLNNQGHNVHVALRFGDFTDACSSPRKMRST